MATKVTINLTNVDISRTRLFLNKILHPLAHRKAGKVLSKLTHESEIRISSSHEIWDEKDMTLIARGEQGKETKIDLPFYNKLWPRLGSPEIVFQKNTKPREISKVLRTLTTMKAEIAKENLEMYLVVTTLENSRIKMPITWNDFYKAQSHPLPPSTYWGEWTPDERFFYPLGGLMVGVFAGILANFLFLKWPDIGENYILNRIAMKKTVIIGGITGTFLPIILKGIKYSLKYGIEYGVNYFEWVGKKDLNYDYGAFIKLRKIFAPETTEPDIQKAIIEVSMPILEKIAQHSLANDKLREKLEREILIRTASNEDLSAIKAFDSLNFKGLTIKELDRLSQSANSIVLIKVAKHPSADFNQIATAISNIMKYKIRTNSRLIIDQPAREGYYETISWTEWGATFERAGDYVPGNKEISHWEYDSEDREKDIKWVKEFFEGYELEKRSHILSALMHINPDLAKQLINGKEMPAENKVNPKS